MAPSARDVVELFHLLFLRQLGAGADRTLFTLKGGCNLRFYFRSPRYSEDMDLDVRVAAKDALKKKVDRLLESPALLLPLRAQGIEVVDVTSTKQTETTQRWKLGLAVAGQSIPLRTKVELSRRAAQAERHAESVVVEPVDSSVARRHALPPVVAQHYAGPAALVQKVEALVGRPQTQARDVFDLQLLHAHASPLPELSPSLKKRVPEAIDRAMSLSYSDFVSHVVAYLVPEDAQAYEDEATWAAMQLQVVELLEELAT